MRNAVLCGHTGSVNRGCEAIVRSTASILSKVGVLSSLATFAKEQDTLPHPKKYLKPIQIHKNIQVVK